MFINSIIIKNYKLISNSEEIKLQIPDRENEGSGLNILIGENNSGKTTILNSLSAISADNCIINFSDIQDKENFLLTIQAVDGNNNKDIEISVDVDKKKPIYTVDTIKETATSYKNKHSVQVYSFGLKEGDSKQFEYSSKSLIGKLFQPIEQIVIDTQPYKEFTEAFKQCFNNNEELEKEKRQITDDIKGIVKDQFDSIYDMKFDFDKPSPNIIFKNINCLIQDIVNPDV